MPRDYKDIIGQPTSITVVRKEYHAESIAQMRVLSSIQRRLDWMNLSNEKVEFERALEPQMRNEKPTHDVAAYHSNTQ
jgi:hypothetical protein